MKIVYKVNKDKIEFDKQYDGYSTPVAAFNMDENKGFILKGEDFFNRDYFTNAKKFEEAINKKLGTQFNMKDILEIAAQERIVTENNDKLEKHILNTALSKGKSMKPSDITSLPWHIQKDVGGYAEKGGLGFICNIPYEKLYVFNLTDTKQGKMYFELKDEVSDTCWCHCGYTGDNVKYVERYRGVNHGWICPKCKRFKQIG